MQWVQISTLTPLERAYVRPGEAKTGRIRRGLVVARQRAAAGAELSRMRDRGESIAIREIDVERGRRILTTAVADRQEA
jgi:hypothetical protein